MRIIQGIKRAFRSFFGVPSWSHYEYRRKIEEENYYKVRADSRSYMKITLHGSLMVRSRASDIMEILCRPTEFDDEAEPDMFFQHEAHFQDEFEDIDRLKSMRERLLSRLDIENNAPDFEVGSETFDVPEKGKDFEAFLARVTKAAQERGQKNEDSESDAGVNTDAEDNIEADSPDS